MITHEFGTRLRELRKQAGLSQRELADKVGINFTYLSKIESGVMSPPSEKVILRLAEVLKADKDELLALAGKIPVDIAQMLRKREVLELLRSRRTQKKIGATNKREGISMKHLFNYRTLSRVAIAVILVASIGTSLWFVSPTPVKAFSVDVSVANSPISGNTTYLLGEKINIPANIQFDLGQYKTVQSVSVNITGTESFTKVLPLDVGNYVYTDLPGQLDVAVTWDTGMEFRTGYGYGYTTGEGKINYSVNWTPPYAASAQPTPPPVALPGVSPHFDISVPASVNTVASPTLYSPQGLAYDSTNQQLYILVPASYYVSGNVSGYRDIIIVTDTSGNYDSFIAAPGDTWETEALTFVGSTLYAAYNEWDATTWTTKGKVAKYVSDNWTTIAGLSNLNPIGGLASDGTSLFVAYRDQLKIDKRDATTGALIQDFDLSAAWGGGMAMGPPIWGFDALAYSTDLYAAQGETVIKVDASTGAKTGEYKTGKWDILGLEFVSETYGGTTYSILYLATSQWPGKVFRASKPGEVVVVEKTPVGNYSTLFKVIADSTTYTDTSTFTLGKLATAPTVTIASPTEGFAVAAGSENITVTGSINDPSISTVSVGIALPEVTAFADTAENATQTQANWQHSAVAGSPKPWMMPYDSTADLWHRDDERDHTTGTGWSWRYADEDTGFYATGYQANAGALRTKDPIAIGDNNVLTFWTWYDTELPFWPDRKLVEVSTDGTTWRIVAWLAQFWPPFLPPDLTQAEYNALTSVPLQQWTEVTVSLADYAGQSIYLRFRFDTMDDITNEGEGWYIDDISITGAGFLGVTASVDANRQFSTVFTLAEGSNSITATAARTNYEPKLTGTASVSGSLDTVKPTITLDPVTTPTKQNYQLISGRVVEANFDRLELKKGGVLKWSTTVLGTGGTFSQSILLDEGDNNFFIEVKDKVGLTANVTATVKLDTVGPVFNAVFTGGARYDVAYITGEVSARPGDMFFLALSVSDNATQVDRVTLLTPGGPEADGPRAMKKTDLPDAVIDSWGIKSATKTAMNYVQPMQVPVGAPTGDYSLIVKAYDTAGNSANMTVAIKIVTTLEAFNIYLMPDWNLVSSPLIPTTDNITALTSGIAATELFEKVWYYDASKAGTVDEWKVYIPGVGGDLTKLEAGKGYWFKMKDLAAFRLAGKVSTPMMTGLPDTPAPIKLTIAGQVLEAGAKVPPTYPVYAGWNLVGLHSEYPQPVSTALSAVTVPQQKWGSLLQYLNYIYFPMQEGAMPEIDLGRFNRLISTDTMKVGRGFWLYMVESGTLVP